MTKYKELKGKSPIHPEVFFAFSEAQFEMGKESIPKDKKLLKVEGINGMYGTKEGLDYYDKFYNDLEKEIAEQCTPEEVYEYEFNNYECGYTHDDEEARTLTNQFFPEFVVTDKLRNKCQKQFDRSN